MVEKVKIIPINVMLLLVMRRKNGDVALPLSMVALGHAVGVKNLHLRRWSSMV
jgi:hypothetical protein